MSAQTRVIHYYVCLGAAGGKECKVKMKQDIVNLAFYIQQKADDEQGSRVTVDDLSCFIAKLVTENEYDKHYNSLNDSPVNSMNKWEILDRFYSNNYI